MPGKTDKQHRIRVRTLDGKPRDQNAINKLKSNQLGMPYLDIVCTSVATEFIICAPKDTHIAQVRSKLGGAGLEAIDGGATTVPASATSKAASSNQNPQPRTSRPPGPNSGASGATAGNGPDLSKKPYGFVAVPAEFRTSPPIWHDCPSRGGRLSGEIRLEIEALTPLLVGWERRLVREEGHGDWPIDSRADGPGQSMNIDGRWSRPIADKKPVLCPLRAPWGERPVVIPGDTLKGLLRHELGALLGAPMERVAERSYSYRPNAKFAEGARLIPRIARVPADGVTMGALNDRTQVRVPTRLDLLPTNLRYDKKREQNANYYRFDDGNGATYRGGQGAGERLNSKRNLHRKLTVNPSQPTESAPLSQWVQDGYIATVRHLVDPSYGHFSERHPDVPKTVTGDAARARILQAAKDEVFQPGDLVWVEWDTEKKCIVSLGWHYYYRWAYTDSVRTRGSKLERHGLFPLPRERESDGDGAPRQLSAVRRLLGYTGDNDGSKGIGHGDHQQLMGRLFVNAAVEVVEDGDTEESRFLKPTFLKELGMPRPSAVEHYLKQPYYQRTRPSDRAQLVTYGDAAGYDSGGELAGRKFYYDRKDAYAGEPWKDDSDANRLNDRSTLALDASRPGRRFRFTMRFRDLDPAELAAALVALAPNQFSALLGGAHPDGYCSKLGYARPLGWGSVRIEAKQLLWLDEGAETPTLRPEADLASWVSSHHETTPTQGEWLAIHRRNHPNAADYPRAKDRDGAENIYTFHTALRAEHSRNRRYKNGGAP